jgi:imidazolonepropionase-like amidohydrolase
MERRFISSSRTIRIRCGCGPREIDPPIKDGTILVHNGRIRAIGPSAKIKVPRFARAVTVLDCQGLVVTTGFWNSHVHIFTPGLLHAKRRSSDEISLQLEQMLTRWGFTTVFDLASVLDNTNNIRPRIEKGEVRGPRILTVGEPFYPKGGTPIYVKGFLEENHIPSAEVQSTPQALERVRQQISNAADGIKIFAGAMLQAYCQCPQTWPKTSFPKPIVPVNRFSRTHQTLKGSKLPSRAGSMYLPTRLP